MTIISKKYFLTMIEDIQNPLFKFFHYNMKHQQSKFKPDPQSRSSSSDLKAGSTVYNQKYLLAQLIGKGSFGQVYRSVSTLNVKQEKNHRYPIYTAIKVQNDMTKASQIANELAIIGAIFKNNNNPQGFPKLYASGVESGHAFMIMDLLGPNLQDLMVLCGGKFSLKTAILLIIQIFERIQVLHQLGYVYRDIKPENFLMGIGKKSKELFMVDFGLCKRFRDQNTRLFLPYKESISMVGTIRYSSLNSHLGIDQTRRDDLQSICYMLVYFLNGSLPWQGLAFQHKFQKDHMIMDSKLKITPQQLCKDLPQQIKNIFEYIKGLDFYQDPDYRFIVSELTYLFENKCDLIDLQYDWQKLPSQARLNKSNIQIIFPQQANIEQQLELIEQNQPFNYSNFKKSTYKPKKQQQVNDLL